MAVLPYQRKKQELTLNIIQLYILTSEPYEHGLLFPGSPTNKGKTCTIQNCADPDMRALQLCIYKKADCKCSNNVLNYQYSISIGIVTLSTDFCEFPVPWNSMLLSFTSIMPTSLLAYGEVCQIPNFLSLRI